MISNLIGATSGSYFTTAGAFFEFYDDLTDELSGVLSSTDS